MYINRKDGTLVEARFKYNIGFWKIYKSGNLVKELEDKDFQEQYVEAVVNPKDKSNYIHGKMCTCELVGCIPYIPEEYDVDNEPTFPICGTCNYIKDKNLEQSNLMLSDVEKQKYIHKSKVSYGDITVDEEIVDVDGLLKAELKHLEKLGIVYVSRVCTNCNDSGCACDKCWDGVQFIPFSEYRKENEK